MPTIRRRKTERRADAIESQRIQQKLLCGSDFRFLDPELGENLDHSQLRRAWQHARGGLLTRYAEEEGLYRRPWAWWTFDATEPRRWIDDEPMPPICDSKRPYFGMPYTQEPGAAPCLIDGSWETEKDYLLRHHDLLTDTEKAEARTPKAERTQ